MTPEQIVGLSLALLIMIVGLIGTVIPGIPGTPLILVGAVAHRIYFGNASANNWIIALLVVMTALALLVDYLAGMVGARKLGATWRGVLGAVLGGIVGLFFSIPGIILGPFVGATLLEIMGGREFKPAARAGAGATLGLLVGGVGKISISVAMIVLFTLNVVHRS